jgi:hypothetical protein
MNNFSELLDTDPKLSICVSLEPVIDNGEPLVWIRINSRELFCSKLMFGITVDVELPLLDPFKIEIGMSDKKYNETLETAVIIRSLKIDDFEIIPNWTNLSEYQNERDINRPVSYMGYNGVWSLTVPEPFYRWRHVVTGQGWLLEPMLQKNNTR